MLSKPDQRGGKAVRRRQRAREAEPMRFFAAEQVATIRIAGGYPPDCVRRRRGLGELRDQGRLRRIDRLDGGIDQGVPIPGDIRIDEKLRRRQGRNAAESADKMRPLDMKPPECEIRKIGIKCGAWMSRKKAASHPRILRRLRPPDDADPAEIERISGAGLGGKQDRGSRIGLQITRVQGKPGDQKDLARRLYQSQP